MLFFGLLGATYAVYTALFLKTYLDQDTWENKTDIKLIDELIDFQFKSFE